MKRLALLALALSAPLAAQPAAPVAAEAPQAISPVAAEVAAKLFPDGTYRRLLGPSFTQMMSKMVDGGMSNVPLGALVKAVGLDADAASKLDKATLGEIMDIIDPAYKQRMRLMMDAMFSEMIPLFEKMEPDLRDGLAISLQTRFSQAQLGELKAFFATPTGNAYATQQMTLFMDPAVMGKMQLQMPKIMEAMPALIGRAAKATEGLPQGEEVR